jgi:hypothetical protein
MSGNYYQYESGQSYVSVPKAIAQALGWDHKNKVKIEIKTINNKTGIFIVKEEK